MKIARSAKLRRTSEGGNILIIALILSTIMGMTLAAYLDLVTTQHRSVARSQSWNTVIPMVEAGIEESVAHLNTIGAETNRSVDGWKSASIEGTNFHYMTRTLGEGRYEVFIDDQEVPTIISTAYTTLPLSTNEVARSVVVGTQKQASLWVGMVAKGSIALGPGSAMDSFNSGDPSFSSNGKYDPSKANDNSFVGSVTGTVTGGGAGKTAIFGTVGTGPTGSATDVTVGDATWHSDGNTGIQPNHYNNDLNMTFPDAVAPFTSGSVPGDGDISVTNYTYSTNSVTSESYPSPPPDSGITTNTTTTVTDTYPSDYSGTVSTNEIEYTSATHPGSGYSVTTNTTPVTGATEYPADGTYLGEVSVIPGKGQGSKSGDTYNYNRIDDYTYVTETYSYTTQAYTYDTTVTTTNVTTDYYAYILNDGNYSSSSVSLSGSDQILIAGDAVWYIGGDFELSGNAQLTVSQNGSLELYVAGPNMKIAGNGAVNLTESAINMQIYGLPTATEVKMAGNAEFIGVVYAPQATLKGAGGGSDAQDFSGAGIFNLVDYNGKFSFHYDELLADLGDTVRFNIASWDEAGQKFTISGWSDF